jgi:hypothetical protein
MTSRRSVKELLASSVRKGEAHGSTHTRRANCFLMNIGRIDARLRPGTGGPGSIRNCVRDGGGVFPLTLAGVGVASLPYRQLLMEHDDNPKPEG